MIRTFCRGLENIHACSWIFDNFPEKKTHMSAFLEKLSENHLHAWLFSNPQGKVLKSIKCRGQIFPILLKIKTKNKSRCLCCTLRSGLHDIPTMISTFPCGFETNHACKWISGNIPGMLIYVLFLDNPQKSICMHGWSQIHVERC